MTDQKVQVFDYAEELISTPRHHLRLTLSQDQDGLALSYQDRPLVRCPLTREGMIAAGFLAKALGKKIPALGESTDARVSTGVLFRAVSIVSLDFTIEESYVLLDRWLEEAEMQRGGSSAEE